MKLLRKALVEGSFLLDLHESNVTSIFHRVLDYVVARGVLPAERRDEVEAGLLEREQQSSTAIGNALAVPHTYTDAFTEPVIVFVRLSHPINMGAPDGVQTRFLFVLLGPTSAMSQHLDALADVARLMSDDEFRFDAGRARTQLDLLAALDDFKARTAPPPERPAPEEETTVYDTKLFGGWIADIRRRLPHYRSYFVDGLNLKSVASTLFLYFACLAPAITFGGIMAAETNNNIGVVEMIVASALCGVIFALFSGQPLVILGGTGPLLIFTIMLYGLCEQLNIEGQFLEARAWVGLWTALFLILLAITNTSSLIKYFTRFTDEIFAALISIIFIYYSVKALTVIVTSVYQPGYVRHDEALVPLLLAGGTFFIALQLSRFRRSRFLLPKIREFLADFGPTIAIVAMTAVALVWFVDVKIDFLNTPEDIKPSMRDRNWLLNIFDVPRWVWFAAIGPALLAAVLVYLDQNITARLINSRDHKLQKGEAYHHDLAVMGLLIGICSLFGLPWLVAATVRSLNHVRSLATVEEVLDRNGETHERILHVRETRLTGLAIHLFIGLSVIALPLLENKVPMAVLYGLFLFMGIVSMTGNQFFERLRLWLMDSSLYPSTHYIRRVPRWTIHKFTFLQLICLLVLGIVDVTRLGILFPLFVLLLVPVRFLAGRFFAAEHLLALDSEEEPEEEESQWV